MTRAGGIKLNDDNFQLVTVGYRPYERGRFSPKLIVLRHPALSFNLQQTAKIMATLSLVSVAELSYSSYPVACNHGLVPGVAVTTYKAQF